MTTPTISNSAKKRIGESSSKPEKAVNLMHPWLGNRNFVAAIGIAQVRTGIIVSVFPDTLNKIQILGSTLHISDLLFSRNLDVPKGACKYVRMNLRLLSILQYGDQ
jgi:hypothetical protein